MLKDDIVPGQLWMESPNRFRRLEKDITGDPWERGFKQSRVEDLQNAVIAAQKRDFPAFGKPLGYHYGQDMRPYLVWSKTDA